MSCAGSEYSLIMVRSHYQPDLAHCLSTLVRCLEPLVCSSMAVFFAIFSPYDEKYLRSHHFSQGECRSLRNPKDEPLSRLTLPGRIRPCSSLLSPTHLRRISPWRQQCFATHSNCPNTEPRELPTRVIAVNSADADCGKLVSTHRGRRAVYACLSYSWGSSSSSTNTATGGEKPEYSVLHHTPKYPVPPQAISPRQPPAHCRRRHLALPRTADHPYLDRRPLHHPGRP